MTATLPIIGEKCHYCQKTRAYADMNKMGESIRICIDCLAKHNKAMEALETGELPEVCAECGKTRETLEAEAPGDQVPMYLHMLEGVYVLVCRACNVKITHKRKEMYRPTRFGWEQKI